jgi:hypothetical protein
VNFRSMGDCLLWAVAWKLQRPTFLGHFVQWLSLSNTFDGKWVGLHFGRIFHKLIWSPCFRDRFVLSSKILDVPLLTDRLRMPWNGTLCTTLDVMQGIEKFCSTTMTSPKGHS